MGTATGLSTISTTELASVTIGGRLTKDFKLDVDLNDNTTPLKSLIYGQTNPLLPPTSDQNSQAFEFNVVVGNLGLGKDLPIYVDPVISIGYDFEVLLGSFFESVVLPSLGDDLYELWLFDAALNQFYLAEDNLLAGDTYHFGVGVDRFRVYGIEPQLGLDPSDPMAFVVGLTFTELGEVSFKMTAITQEISVPEPDGSALILIGFVGVAGMCFKRKCQSSSASVF